jgi:hypothetical protein
MDERIQAYLRAVVDLEGNFQAEVREGVRICLADYEKEVPRHSTSVVPRTGC